MNAHVLMIDDDARLTAMVRDYLQASGFVVSVAGDLARGRAALQRESFDALILDLMLPDGDGLDLTRELRADPRCRSLPLLMLTARGEPMDRILGLELGADDYLAKPCDPRELTARLRAVLRRSLPPATVSQLQLGDLCSSQARGVVSIGEQEISLTLSESRILEALMQQPGEPVDKQALAQLALGRKLTLYDRSLDMHVSNLRKKLGPHDDGRPRIVALRSRGYYYSL